jgi:hypothetical protein
MLIMRTLVCLLAAFAFVGLLSADDKPAKPQMVKGTIKSVDADKSVLVINQKVKNEVVDRELSITKETEFVIQDGSAMKSAFGKEGLFLIEKQIGASVTVKCDKDVNVLKVTVKMKK